MSGLAHATTLPLGQAAPSVHLVDANPASDSYRRTVRASADKGSVTLWYFLGDDDVMRAQIAKLQDMRTEMQDDRLSIDVRVVVPNAMAGQIEGLAKGHDLPLLVDTDDKARAAWSASDGDLVLLDLDGRVRDAMPLGKDDLRQAFVAFDLESRIETLIFDLGSATEALARKPL